MRKLLPFWVATLLLLTGCVGSPADDRIAATANPPEASSSAENQAVEEAEVEVEISEGFFKLSAINWDETPYPNFEIWISGRGSWFPDLENGDLLTEIGPFPLGELQEQSLFIYPRGRDGQEFEIPITLSEDHISNSDRDMLQIWVEDGVLRVFGTQIPDYEMMFDLD
jgi:hypothetical protein